MTTGKPIIVGNMKKPARLPASMMLGTPFARCSNRSTSNAATDGWTPGRTCSTGNRHGGAFDPARLDGSPRHGMQPRKPAGSPNSTGGQYDSIQ